MFPLLAQPCYQIQRVSTLGLEMSCVESNSFELDSIKIGSIRNSTRVQHGPFLWLEFDSFKAHE